MDHPTTNVEVEDPTLPTPIHDDGLLIAVEGIDGSGTTTVTDAIGDHFDEVVTTKEPAEQYWTGDAARQAINDDETHPMTDFHFFLGDRAYHIENTIQPALEEGKTVVSDRYAGSTIAYQQENLRGVVDSPKQYIHDAMVGWVEPVDLVILLDCPADVAQERASGDDKYEVSDFQKKARQNYLELAGGKEVIKLDSSRPKSAVIEDAIEAITELTHD